jgi:hypothetical protein
VIARFSSAAIILLAAFVLLPGCSSRPDQANILLRKENQSLADQIGDLQRQNAGLNAQIIAMQARSNSISSQLPESELEKLFTVHAFKLGSLTGGYNPTGSGPDQMLQVFAVPMDEQGQPLKAAGSFKIELFDLSEPDTRLGTWNFSTEQARQDWFGQAFQYTYEFDCPWQTPPQHADLLVKVTFTDELTGRVFWVSQNVTVKPPNGAEK